MARNISSAAKILGNQSANFGVIGVMTSSTASRQERGREYRSAPDGPLVVLLGTLAAGALLFGACGTQGNPISGSPGVVQGGALVVDRTSRCTTAVHGVVPGPASLSAQWLPAGFRITSGTPSDPSAGLTYTAENGGPDPARIELHLGNSPGPLVPSDGPRPTAVTVEVQGNPALFETGAPDPDFMGVYWKPIAGDLLTIVGYKLPAETVIETAQHVAFSAPQAVSLPLSPGPIISGSTAVTEARHVAHSPRFAARAKLSSWTEVNAMLHASRFGSGPTAIGGGTETPWKPVWAVLLSSADQTSGSGTRSSSDELVVVDADTGKLLSMTATEDNQAWFIAMTNRDPTLGGCPGGSNSRLPFGVLTRDEEAYAVAHLPGPAAQGPITSNILKLTTVTALNQADPGLYGGCVQQDCSLRELIWPAIVIVHAPPGRTLACLPPSASYPPGYRPKQVHEYVTISVLDNSSIYCGSIPSGVKQLTDLAPAATG
jgi:hypothetical protein